MRQASNYGWSSLQVMTNGIKILTLEPDGDDGLIVTFSDGTTAAYVAEELLKLRPKRKLTSLA